MLSSYLHILPPLPSQVGFFLLHYPQLWRLHFTKLVTLYQAGLLKVALDPTPFKGLPAVPSAVEHLQAGSSVGKVVVEISPSGNVSPSSRL
ncbi:unnamed protein product [Closterium sp. NIES-54]